MQKANTDGTLQNKCMSLRLHDQNSKQLMWVRALIPTSCSKVDRTLIPTSCSKVDRALIPTSCSKVDRILIPTSCSKVDGHLPMVEGL